MIRKRIPIQKAIQNGSHYVNADIWKIPLNDLPNLLLRASSLTFYSIFIIVPVVALALGIARSFDLEMYVEQQLHAALEGQEEVLHWVLTIVDSFLQQLHLHGGTLAATGLALLLSSLFMLLVNMERSFNEIWQVEKGRVWYRKLSDFLAIIIIAPALFVIACAATVFLNTVVEDLEIFLISPVMLFAVNLTPFLLIWIALTLLYVVMPNTHVKLSSALFAAVIAGTILQLIQWGYITLQIGATTYSTMYGSFAAIPLMLLWMQISWFVVLFGAELSFANQHIDAYRLKNELRNISPFHKKIFILYILQLLVKRYEKGYNPLTAEEVAQKLQIPYILARNVLNELDKAGLVKKVETKQKKKDVVYQPNTDIQTLSIKTVLERLEHLGAHLVITEPSPKFRALEKTLKEFYNLMEKSDKNILLKDLQD